jgi:hypothetical protein
MAYSVKNLDAYDVVDDKELLLRVGNIGALVKDL